MLIGLLLLPLAATAQKAIPAPTNYLVNDYAGLLSREQVVALGEKLTNYVRETSTQIVIITMASLEGDDAFEYSVRLAQEWGIGGGEYDNGVLLFVARDERQVRIQTGYGAEGFLPDAMAKRIIDNVVVPAFREGQYYAGLDQATDIIMDLGKGEYTGEGTPQQRKAPFSGWSILAFIIILILVMSVFNRRGGGDDEDDDGGYWRGGRYDMGRGRRRRGGGWIFIPGPWMGGGWGGGGGSGGGGGFGGFGGGGFGGFGGGGFGGGGAGGSW